MNSVRFWMFLLFTGLILNMVAQVKPGYEQYEKEDLSPYRIRVDFAEPVVRVVPDTVIDVVYPDAAYLPKFAYSNKTHIEAPPKLGQLVIQHIAANSRVRTLPGYRIQLVTSTERAVVAKVKSDFSMSFPDIPSYMPYISPTYRVRVGDFLDRDEAVAACARIRQVFEGAFIVAEEVNVPRN